VTVRGGVITASVERLFLDEYYEPWRRSTVATVSELEPEMLVEDEVPDWMTEEWLWTRPSPEMEHYLELDLPIAKPARWPAFSWESV